MRRSIPLSIIWPRNPCYPIMQELEREFGQLDPDTDTDTVPFTKVLFRKWAGMPRGDFEVGPACIEWLSCVALTWTGRNIYYSIGAGWPWRPIDGEHIWRLLQIPEYCKAWWRDAMIFGD